MLFPLNRLFKSKYVIKISKCGQFREVKLPKYTFHYTQVVNHYNNMATQSECKQTH